MMLAAVAIAVLFATRWDVWTGAWTRQTTGDAYVRGDITPLSAKVEAYVRRVPVNRSSRPAICLVEIDGDGYRARVAQAEADLLGAPGGDREPQVAH